MASVLPAAWPQSDDVDLLREVVRQAEAQMQDMQAMALAGDARANAQAYTLAAVAAGLLVAGVTLSTVARHDCAAIYAVIGSAAGFLVSAGVAMWAARPVLFFTRGYNPTKLADQHCNEALLLRWSAEDLADRLKINRAAMKRTTRLTMTSHAVSLAAIVVPALAYEPLRWIN